MNLGLEGKVVLISGGSKGIGLACARAFASGGARVSIASRAPENLDRARQTLAADGLIVVPLRADFSKPEEAQSAAASTERTLGPVDILINCAGAANRYQVDAYTAESWQQGLNSKYFPQVHAMDAVRPGMIQRKRGAIVNVMGMGGKSAQQVFLSGGAANAALMLVTVGWANALGRHGIRVNGINPGSTLTDRVQRGIQADAKAQGITEAEALERNQAKIPLGRFARPEEVAAVALFLASDQATYVTGVPLSPISKLTDAAIPTAGSRAITRRISRKLNSSDSE
jgi:NAD(P)-dependent dehydrogenase (short-subunit alcohol dehydrogenase family)